jgi:acetolactate synthase-1/2/3 large subunit
MAETMKKAFHIARTGRPGPVVDAQRRSFNKTLYTGIQNRRDSPTRFAKATGRSARRFIS